jgi:hypothetical protein
MSLSPQVVSTGRKQAVSPFPCRIEENEVSSRMGRAKSQKVSCKDCFFRQHGLCALAQEEACVTFRPFDPEQLKPARQMRFEFRQERRTRAVWAFPSPQEQAALPSR